MVQAGQLAENIPRKMRVAIPVIVEARIARSDVKALADGLQGDGAVYHHEVTVTKAMSVRLRAPDGGFFIETASPETQWIENVQGLMSNDYASWRWSVTPKDAGKKRLQMVISARTVGADGLAAETALPDQIVDVKVGINVAKTAKRMSGWILAAVAGGVLARFGEDLFVMARTFLGAG
jgi:neural Wiskott-Aldrich syndrome protein